MPCWRRWRGPGRRSRCGCRGGAASPWRSCATAGTLTDESLELVRLVVGARLAFLVTGGTGSGKTTLLSALLGAVDPAERIVVVEDATELRPDHPHVVGLEARPANLEGAGAVALRDLVRQALRMRPDRLVVGEVRDGAVVDLMAAMNTGHEGGCGTLHANSAADLPARIEALALAAGLGRAAAHSQLASALDVVLHMTRDRDGQRRLGEVAVLERDEAGLVRTVDGDADRPGGRAVRRSRRRPAARPDRVPAASVTGWAVVTCVLAGCCGAAADPARRSAALGATAGPSRRLGSGSAWRPTSCGCSCSARWRWGRSRHRSCAVDGRAPGAGSGGGAVRRSAGRARRRPDRRDRARAARRGVAGVAAGRPYGGRRRRRTGSAAGARRAARARATSAWWPPPGRSRTAPGTGSPTRSLGSPRSCGTPNRPAGWSSASWPRRGPPPAWSPACRWPRC